MKTKLNIVVCPLNWGLGHATRCSPIIDALIHRGHQVHLASDGLALELLKRHYPLLPIHTLASLSIKYGTYFWIKMGIQLFSIWKWMAKDRRKIKALHDIHHFDLIISDSRVACHIPGLPSVLVISQTAPRVPSFINRIYQKVLNGYLKLFDRIWIPDVSHDVNVSLSGELITLPSNVQSTLVGLLTRINPKSAKRAGQSISAKKILAIVSGPEPSRTQFEENLFKALEPTERYIVGGRPDQQHTDKGYSAYMEPDDLAQRIHDAQYIICRGGYSTLMDLAGFNKKLILVPTPGQSEQEYLAHRLQAKDQAVVWPMDNESWTSVRAAADRSKGFYLNNDKLLLQLAIDEIEEYCKKKSKFRR